MASIGLGLYVLKQCKTYQTLFQTSSWEIRIQLWVFQVMLEIVSSEYNLKYVAQ